MENRVDSTSKRPHFPEVVVDITMKMTQCFVNSCAETTVHNNRVFPHLYGHHRV